MGCFSSRDQKSEIKTSRTDPMQKFLIEISLLQLNETLVLKSAVYNLRFSREDQAWVLRKKKALYTMNSIGMLEKETHQAVSHSMISTYDIPMSQQPFMIRPPPETFPTCLLRLQKESIYFQGLEKRIVTALQAGVNFPQNISSLLLFSNGPQKLNLQNNGKFTFVLTWSLNKQSQLQFRRCLQLYKHRWSRHLPDQQREIYGLCHGYSIDDKKAFEEEATKMKWTGITHIFTYPGEPQTELWNASQVFNLYTEDMQLSREETFTIIGPNGKVIRCDRPNFKGESQRSPRNTGGGNNGNDSQSECSMISNDLRETQMSHQMQFERGIEKEIRKQLQERRISQGDPGLQRSQLFLMSLLQKLQTQVVNKEQFQDFKQLLSNQELMQFLSNKFMGESFQIELPKWVLYRTENSVFKEYQRLYLIPSVYPACSSTKEHYIPQIIQYLNETIPLAWRTPSISSYTIPREHTIIKKILMEEIHKQLQEIDYNNLTLFIQKKRIFEWRKNQNMLPQENALHYISDDKWVPCDEVERGIHFISQIVKVDNIPVGFEGYKNYGGMITYAIDAQESRQNPDKSSIQFQGLDSITFQLITDFYTIGISAEVRLGSKYVPIPQCYKLDQVFSKKLPQGDDKQINFIDGQPTLIILVDWDSESSISSLKNIFQNISQYQDFNQNQALSGIAQEDKKLRAIILGSDAKHTESIDAGVKAAFGVESDEELRKFEMLEFWLPQLNYLEDNEEYLFSGMLCKFYGLEADQNNMLLFGSMGQLLFRGSDIIECTEVLNLSLKNEIMCCNSMQDTFFAQFPEVSHEDFNWRVIKQYFRKNKIQLDALFSGLNKTSQSGSFYRIESTKYKVWDSNKGQFKDYSSKVKVRYSLDEQSQQILKEVTDAFKDLF